MAKLGMASGKVRRPQTSPSEDVTLADMTNKGMKMAHGEEQRRCKGE